MHRVSQWQKDIDAVRLFLDCVIVKEQINNEGSGRRSISTVVARFLYNPLLRFLMGNLRDFICFVMGEQ